ncbi:hypothetical protein NQ166_09530 [Microbacterium sp. zg.Y1090]|uniref:hypothetical protein n=1 Tax=Microbacterium TaxID=33882 RepID=UPI00214CB072|nr:MULTISPECIES: hypothetical protein [unclassified Microbacterium]MCR2811517.1 hypothetical protein [Microbacterium sp. zg.Y1084]MCR2819065.1 hypothetical protein [Microbacterium sp. zg.Y1090]MDL5487711.1 hypothetical protein [Microbacterium sp. zg-Y1211]WIM27368.1 hypothetical protein QNO26_09340 [Microbacterium sp. zg-Y1090]
MPSGFDVSPMSGSSFPPRYRAPVTGMAEVFRVWLPGEDEDDRRTVGHLIRQEPDGLAFMSGVGSDDGDAMQGNRRLIQELLREGFAAGTSVTEMRDAVYRASLTDDIAWVDLDDFYATIREEWYGDRATGALGGGGTGRRDAEGRS